VLAFADPVEDAVKQLMLSRFARFEDIAFLLLRLYLGSFLIWGVWDNINSSARMEEFAAFLQALNCPLPQIAAPVSVWVQLAIGILLIPGVFTRLAGGLLSVNFIVAVALMAGAGADGRSLFDPAIVVFVGLILASHGAGRWSVDQQLLTR
jgi:putative oxidoreductase